MITNLLLSAIYADGDNRCLDVVTALDDHLDVVNELLVVDERAPVQLISL